MPKALAQSQKWERDGETRLVEWQPNCKEITMDFNSYMVDEILVTRIDGLCHETLENRWEITSHPHAKYLAELTGQTVYTDTNLETLRKLGYAVCNNTLDCHGRKVYIHHNTRTFKESKEIKNV